MVDVLKWIPNPKDDSLTYLMFFLPIFTSGYLYYYNQTNFDFWILIVSTFIILLMESYHFAYVSIITPKDARKIDKGLKKDETVFETINKVRPLANWYLFVVFIWMVMYIYIITRLFSFDSITMRLLGVFQSSLIIFLTLKSLFLIILLKQPNKINLVDYYPKNLTQANKKIVNKLKK